MSTIRAATIADLAGTGPTTLMGQTAAKAWVTFQGDGTVAINASANISSLTDNATGDYTANFTAALTDGHYSVVGTPTSVGVANIQSVFNIAAATVTSPPTTKTASACRFAIGFGSSGAATDMRTVCAEFTR